MKRTPLISIFTLVIVSLTALSLGVTPARAAGPLCYVDDSAVGSNDGTSWINAYTSLQSALTDSGCSEIWVAAGTYYPGASGTRTATFQLKNGVEI
ncbi:MAG: hypothetical protein JW726_12965, partial [Anaerolineales bacterium]|nr:hypothetical protein [Anaerolineales bacterium]